jgi:hypothetical protein
MDMDKEFSLTVIFWSSTERGVDSLPLPVSSADMRLQLGTNWKASGFQMVLFSRLKYREIQISTFLWVNYINIYIVISIYFL